MNPETIVQQAADLGVLLHLTPTGGLGYLGQLPANWVELAGSWLPFRDQVLQYLENPPWAHRVALAKATAALAKRAKGAACVHRLELIEAKPACGCGPRYRCAKHGECVLYGALRSVQTCSRCLDFSAVE